jgi:hypothetical protein
MAHDVCIIDWHMYNRLAHVTVPKRRAPARYLQYLAGGALLLRYGTLVSTIGRSNDRLRGYATPTSGRRPACCMADACLLAQRMSIAAHASSVHLNLRITAGQARRPSLCHWTFSSLQFYVRGDFVDVIAQQTLIG